MTAVTGILTMAIPIPVIAVNFYKINENVGIVDLRVKVTRSAHKEEDDKLESVTV